MMILSLAGKECLESDAFDKSDVHKEFEAMGGPSIFTRDTDPHWGVARKGTAPAFSISNINRVHHRFIEQVLCLEKVFDQAQSEKEMIDITDVLMKISMDVLFATMFAEKGGSLSNNGDGAKLLKIIPEIMVELNGFRSRSVLPMTRTSRPATGTTFIQRTSLPRFCPGDWHSLGLLITHCANSALVHLCGNRVPHFF